jgi:FkbM family methyltransferase
MEGRGSAAAAEHDELERLLARDAAAEARRAAGLFDALAGPLASRVVLHGAGNLGVKVAEGLRACGAEPVAFSDGNPALAGTKRAGLTVLPPAEAAARYGRSAAFVPSIWNHRQSYGAILRSLRALGCERVVPLQALFWKHAATFLPYYQIDTPEKVLRDADRVRGAFRLLRDAESRRELLQVVRWSLDLEFPEAEPHPSGDDYFPADLRSIRPDEVMLDVGAFDGDTLQAFVARAKGRFRKLVSLEPDPVNFAKLEARVRALPEDVRGKVEARRLGAGETAGRISFQCDGASTSAVVDLSLASVEVDVVPLDALPLEAPPTYVKMDIEGMEPAALRGARRTIRERAPDLAVCVYHRLEHFWEIPLLIEEIRPGYAFHLRRYSQWPWDVVCYALPRRAARR